jgi:hypothetical protein
LVAFRDKLHSTSILLVAEVGVMLTLNPVISTREADVVVKTSVLATLTTCKTDPAGMFERLSVDQAISPRRKLLDEPVPDAAKLDAETLPPVLGIAFNTELTRKLSVTTASPTVQALFRTTVVPVVAV